jgi:hypothetical protein
MGTTMFAAVVMAASLPADVATHVSDCRATYKYAIPGGQSNAAVDVNRGQTATVQKTDVLQVSNAMDRPLSIHITVPTGGTKWVRLATKGAIDPPLANYVGNVTLIEVRCEYLYPTAGAMVATLKGQNTPVSQIAGAVHAEFGVGGAEMAQLLLTAGLVSGAGAALKNTYSAAAQDVAQWLRGAGAAVGVASTEVRSAFAPADLEAVIAWLAQGGYTLDQLAAAYASLKNQFGPGKTGFRFRGELLGSLREAGFAAPAIAASYMQHNLGSSAPPAPFDIALSFRYAYRPNEETALALKDGLGLSGAQVVGALAQSGGGFYGDPLPALTMAQIADAVRLGIGAGGAELLAWLHSANRWSAADIGSYVRTTFSAVGAQMAAWLRQAQSPLAFTAEVLSLYSNTSGNTLATWLHGAGYPAGAAATVFKATTITYTYGAIDPKSSRGIAGSFRHAGYTAPQTAGALVDPLGELPEDIPPILGLAGYPIDEVGRALQRPLRASATEAATWSKALWAYGSIAGMLRNVYGQDAAATAAVLRQVHGTRPSLPTDELRTALLDGGYSWKEVDDALTRID